MNGLKWLWTLIYGDSSIGRKARIAITGLLMCGFLVSHLAGNLLLFKGDDGESYNNYAKFLHSGEMEAVIAGAEVGLLVLFGVHLLLALVTTRENTAARPTGYAMKQSKQGDSVLAAPAYNVMLLTGIVVFAFLVLHLVDFRFRARVSSHEPVPVVERVDVAHANKHQPITRTDAIRLLRDPLTSGVYIVGCLVLGYHLVHGFYSAFQTLGFNHPRYTPKLRLLSIVFAIVIGVGFAVFPVWAHFVTIPGDAPAAPATTP